MLRITAAVALLCALLTAPAAARHRAPVPAPTCFIFCEVFNPAPPAQKRIVRTRHSAPAAQKHVRIDPRDRSPRSIQAPSQIVPNPDGCPKTLFCGCGAAVRIFGKPIRYLWLAANWLHFARAAPAPGMVAVSRHHVFVLEGQLDRDLWLVYDANSGQHLTRIHARPLTGFVIVNPHSG